MHDLIDFQSWFYRGIAAGSAANPRAETDAVVASSPLASQRECRAGCAYCCHFPVGITSVEVTHLAAWLEKALPADEFAELRTAIEQRAAVIEAESWEKQAAAKRACVLLDAAGRCRAYEQRPVACRGWNSLAVDVCEREFNGDSQGRPASDGPAYVASLGAHEGLRRRGDGHSYELTSALARTLAGHPDLDSCKRPDADR